MINAIYNIISYMLIILGFTYIVISALMPRKIILPNLNKIEVTNEEEYIKSKKKLFFTWGICWVIFGIVLIMGNISKLRLIVPLISLSTIAFFMTDQKINNKYCIQREP